MYSSTFKKSRLPLNAFNTVVNFLSPARKILYKSLLLNKCFKNYATSCQLFMRQTIIFIILTLLTSAFYWIPVHAQGNNKVSSPHAFDIDGVLKRGVLKVAMVKSDQVPFFYNKGASKTLGLDAKLANNIAKRLGVEVEFNRTAEAFNDLVPKVVSGEVDIVISKLSRTSSRAKEVIFTRPYIIFRQALMVNRIGLAKIAPSDEQAAKYLKNFRGDLGVIKDSSYVAYSLLNFPKAKQVEFNSWNEVVAAVLSGKVLAGYRDELEIKKVILSNPDSALRLKTVVLSDTKDNIAMALSPKSGRLREWINIYLEDNNVFFTAQQIIDEYSREIIENAK